MDLKQVIGFGVAGNFTGHLEQAGEVDSFANINVSEANAPKGIFPFYVPNHHGQLGVYPLSSSTTGLTDQPLRVEPEMAILCDVVYGENQMVTALTPRAFTAFNDCTIKAAAPLISDKKNWGAASKGVADRWLPLDNHDLHDADSYRLVSYVECGGALIQLGEDSAIKDYSYFHEKLLTWLMQKMNIQQNEPPLEHIATYLETAGYPRQALITVGATRYTPQGEDLTLQAGDVSYVVVYHDSIDAPQEHLQTPLEHMAVLRQVVVSV